MRALERTGTVEAAARDAGIDKTTAYNRRKAHHDFAAAWEQALRRREGCEVAEVKEKVGFWERVKKGLALSSSVTPPPAVLGCAPHSLRASPPPHQGEGSGPRRNELKASTALGGKMVKAGAGRWNQTVEKRFFDELAATANVRRACAAAGVSTNAVYQRRMKRPDFKAKWDAVLETGRAAIEMHLVESAKKSFDPDDLDVEEVQPKVSVAEAIRIVQLHGTRAQGREIEEVEPPAQEVAAIRERLVKKLEALRERFMAEDLQAGWSYDEEHDHMVPPGWVRAGQGPSTIESSFDGPPPHELRSQGGDSGGASA